VAGELGEVTWSVPRRTKPVRQVWRSTARPAERSLRAPQAIHRGPGARLGSTQQIPLPDRTTTRALRRELDVVEVQCHRLEEMKRGEQHQHHERTRSQARGSWRWSSGR
jgi:hypothetical protein